MARVSASFVAQKFPNIPPYEIRVQLGQKHKTKRCRKRVKSKVLQEFQKLRIYSESNETEDGVESESDWFLSNSHSETGVEGDLEDFHPWPKFPKPVRRKHNLTNSSLAGDDDSSSEESCGEEEEETLFDLSPLSSISETLPPYCRESVLEEACIIHSHFVDRNPPIDHEQFDDEGTLADVEDCDDGTNKSDEEKWMNACTKYLFRIWAVES